MFTSLMKGSGYVQASLYRYGAGMPNNLMYLSMMIRIYSFVSAIVVSTCPCHFVVKFRLSGSFRVRDGVKTSLVMLRGCEIGA